MNLSWDELFQVLLFLPVSDVCHYSGIDSTTYDCVRSNQHLWTELCTRDFGCLSRSSLTTDVRSDSVGQYGCDEMREYAGFHARFGRYPFDRVGSLTMYDDASNCTTSKIVFGVEDSQLLNLSVIYALAYRQLDLQQDDTASNMTGCKSRILLNQSREPKTTPNLTLQFWFVGKQKMHFGLLSMAFYRDAQCVVITVDPKHARNEESYSTSHAYSWKGTNSLSRALAAFKEGKRHLRPPNSCKGVLIVGIDVWPDAAPISKQRFLTDCAQVFGSFPLEYYELTCDNAPEMADLLLRRIYTFHQQALEDGDVLSANVQPIEKPKETTPPQPRCILS